MRPPTPAPNAEPGMPLTRTQEILRVLGLPAPAQALTRDQGLKLFQLSGTKDIGQLVIFQGALSRFTWRFLTHRLTRSGRWFAGLTFALMFVGGTSLEIQAYIAFLYAGAFWLITLVALLFTRPRVDLRTRQPDRIFAGETLTVEADVTALHRRVWSFDLNLLPHRLPLAVDAAEPDGTPVGDLGPGQTRRVRLGLRCPRRGVFKLQGFRVETDFPFGLMNAYRVFRKPETVMVYPAFTPLSRMDLPTGRRHHPGGVALASKLGDSFEFLGNREFREGDNIRDIDWRATARMGGNPIVREWREEYFQRVGLVLDTYVSPRLRARDREGRRAAFERAVSVSAAVSDYMARQEYLVDVFAAGPTLYHLTAGRSLAYLEQILDILACVEESATEPLSVIEPQIQELVDRLTTVVCVFLEWDGARQAFVEGLRQSGVGVMVLLVTGEGAVAAPGDRDVRVIDPAAFAAGVEAL